MRELDLGALSAGGRDLPLGAGGYPLLLRDHLLLVEPLGPIPRQLGTVFLRLALVERRLLLAIVDARQAIPDGDPPALLDVEGLHHACHAGEDLHVPQRGEHRLEARFVADVGAGLLLDARAGGGRRRGRVRAVGLGARRAMVGGTVRGPAPHHGEEPHSP